MAGLEDFAPLGNSAPYNPADFSPVSPAYAGLATVNQGPNAPAQPVPAPRAPQFAGTNSEQVRLNRIALAKEAYARDGEGKPVAYSIDEKGRMLSNDSGNYTQADMDAAKAYEQANPDIADPAATPSPAAPVAPKYLKWDQVTNSVKYRVLSNDDQERVRQEFFSTVVVPQVPTEHIDAARNFFDEQTKPGFLSKTAHAIGNAYGSVRDSVSEGIGLVAGEDAGKDSSIANSLRRGGKQFSQGAGAVAMSTSAKMLKIIDRIDSGEKLPDAKDPMGYQYLNPDQRAATRASVEGSISAAITHVSKKDRELAAIPQNPSAAALSAAGQTLDHVWQVFKEHPMDVIYHLAAESAPSITIKMAGAALGGVVGGPVLAIAGMGAGSFSTEYASSLIDGLKDAGVDVGNEGAVRLALSNTKLMSSIEEKARAKALVVGAFDAASAGIAGKVLAPARLAAKPLAREAVNMAAQAPIQGTLGAAGEGFGSIAAGNKAEPGAMAGEFVAEFAGTPAEVAAMALSRGRARLRASPQHRVVESLYDKIPPARRDEIASTIDPATASPAQQAFLQTHADRKEAAATAAATTPTETSDIGNLQDSILSLENSSASAASQAANESISSPAAASQPKMPGEARQSETSPIDAGEVLGTIDSTSQSNAASTAALPQEQATDSPLTPTNSAAKTAASAPIDVQTSNTVEGEKLNKEWTAFSPESGTLSIPRADMPQVAAVHRGPLVNFLNARGVTHEQETVDPATLKPTQGEFSPAKVEKATQFDGGDRSILVSSDNHVLDGHHQWLAKLDSGEPINVIRLNAPVRDLLPVISEFPSATTKKGAGESLLSQHLKQESSIGAASEAKLPETQAIARDLPANIERRSNAEQRKNVADMTPEERGKALLTDDLTGLPNRRAYDEAPRLPVQSRVDLDGFKAINDTFGHDAGDEVLKAVAAHLQASQGDGRIYRIGGDEFPGEFSTPAEATKAMEFARQKLARQQFTFQLPDGSKKTISGVGFSYGIGQTAQDAETALIADKAQRAADGLRARNRASTEGNDRATEGQQADKGRVAPAVEPATPQPNVSGDIVLGTYGVMPSKNNEPLTLKKQGDRFALYQGQHEAIDGESGNPITYHSVKSAIADMKAELKRTPRRFLSTKQGIYLAPEFKGDQATDKESSTVQTGAKTEPTEIQATKVAGFSQGEIDEARNKEKDQGSAGQTATGEANGSHARGPETGQATAKEKTPLTTPADAGVSVSGKPEEAPKFSRDNKSDSVRSVWKSQMQDAIGTLMGPQEPAKGLALKVEAWAKSGKFKQDELNWSGLTDWLKMQDGKVTKEQVQDFIRENGVQIKEVELGGAVSDEAREREAQSRFGKPFDKLSLKQAAEINTALGEEKNDTKFSQWQLPGGENYRELLLTLPDRPMQVTSARKLSPSEKFRLNELEERASGNGERLSPAELSEYQKLADESMSSARDINFRSSHFGQKNILAHVRFNDRTDATGAKTLFIEEIQSDFAQRARKEGVIESTPKVGDKSQFTIQQTDHQYLVKDPVSGYKVDPGKGTVGSEDEARDYAARYFASKTKEHETRQLGRVPSAPFIGKTEAWVALSLKRMIRYAAENGYDKVAWTNGEQQAARYDLSKQVELVRAAPLGDGKFNIAVFKKRGESAMLEERNIDSNRLESMVGKDLASKIAEAPVGEVSDFSGLDLKVGGSGMKSFYDVMLPNIANDILKKLGGGKVGDILIKTGNPPDDVVSRYPDNKVFQKANTPQPQPGFTITPALREKAMGGLPLFDRADAGNKNTGITREDFQTKLGEAFSPAIAKRLIDTGIMVPINNQSSAPKTVQAYYRSGDTVKGFRFKGQTYAVLANITADEVRGLALHEIGVHYGMEAMLGKAKYDSLLARVDDLVNRGDAAAVQARQTATKEAAVPEHVQEETLAYLVQNHPTMGLVREIIAAIKAFLFRKFGIGAEHLTDADMVMLAKAAVKHAASGVVTEGDLAPAFARQGKSGKLDLQGGSIKTSFDAPAQTKLDTVIYDLQDKQIDLKRLQEAIVASGKEITNRDNAYQGEELYHGRVARRTEKFAENELKPLLTDLKARGVNLTDFEEYLHARHAQERNEQIASINPDFEDAGSGMKTAEAKAYLSGLKPEQKQNFEALAGRVDAMVKETGDLLVREGLEKPDTLEAWRATYKHYVPLHRDEAHPEQSGMPKIGQGFSVKGDSSKRALGSDAKVTNILAHIALSREAAITRAEKNRVGLQLYSLALQHKNEGVWATDRPPIVKYLDPRTNTVAERVDPMYKSQPNVLSLRVRGEDRAIIFNANNPTALRMAMALKNLDLNDIGWVLTNVGKFTRWFAAINTQYNPIFGLVNFARDVGGGALNLSSTPMVGSRVEVGKHILPAMKAIWQVDHSRSTSQQWTENEWTKLWDEFQDVGARTGYRETYATPEDRASALVNELKSMERGQTGRAVHAVLNWLSDYNQAIENSVRLAAYKVALDKGMSKLDAASLAKNITVNFNRKGRVAREISPWYAFFNASMQGTARIAETLQHGKKPGQIFGRIGKTIITGGLSLGVMQALLGLGMMGDDAWDKIPEFVKQRNLIIPISDGHYITIPLPQGYLVLLNIGRTMTEWAMSGGQDTGKRMGNMLSVLLDAFNPMGSSASYMQTLLPTIADPMVALSENKDWTGKSIFQEDFNPNDPTPGFKRAKDRATWFSKKISEGINKVTFGTDYQPGAWSPTPDQLDYVVGQMTGGVGREGMKAVMFAASPWADEPLPASKVPIVGRFHGSTTEPSASSSKFYENLKDINMLENEMQGRSKDGGDADALFGTNPEIALLGDAKNIEAQLHAIRKDFKANSDEKEKRDRLAEVYGQMNEFNKQYRQIRAGN